MDTTDPYLLEKRVARAVRLSILVLVPALVLAGRLFELQVFRAAKYAGKVETYQVRRDWVVAPRGRILDRTGRVLADSRPSFTVRAVPALLLERPESVRLLAELLEMPEERITERLRSAQPKTPRVLRRDLDFEQASRIAERELDLRGVDLQTTHVRSYPLGSRAAHVLGHVGEISSEDVDRLEGYRPGDFLGRTGIERVYEKDLRGRNGRKYVRLDANGREVGPFAAEGQRLPEIGSTLHLHLDARLQAVAESLLVGRRGAVCLMDVATGGMLVMASSPAFDLNLFATGIGREDWKRLNADPDHPLLNRAVQALYAPGSTFKMIPFALALEERLVRPDELSEVPCFGGFQFGDRWFGCWEEIGHGRLNLEMGLVRSCDTYFYQIGEKLTVDDLARYAFGAGLGRPTGVDLPQELTGNVPTVSWLNERYGKGKWTQGTLLNLVIGQGENLVTPLQMVRYAAALGNGGKLLAPRIVRAIESPGGAVRAIEPSIEDVWELSPRTWKRLREAMRLVVAHENGTGRVCRIDGFSPAAKTGTAQNPHGPAHSWFLGYAPSDYPEVAFSVLVEAGGHGSDTAAPIARELLLAYLALRGGTA